MKMGKKFINIDLNHLMNKLIILHSLKLLYTSICDLMESWNCIISHPLKLLYTSNVIK